MWVKFFGLIIAAIGIGLIIAGLDPTVLAMIVAGVVLLVIGALMMGLLEALIDGIYWID